MGAATLSVDEKIKIVTDRIALFDPALSAALFKSAMNLSTNIQDYLIDQVPLIDDANPLAIPSSATCFIEQYAVQYQDVTTGQRRFAILKKLYNHPKTSNDDRAGLLLHEAIYRYAILKGNPINSDGVRYFNYVVATKKLTDAGLDQTDTYHEVISKAELNFSGCQKFKNYFYFRKAFESTGISCYNQRITVSSKVKFDINQDEVIETLRVPWSQLEASGDLAFLFGRTFQHTFPDSNYHPFFRTTLHRYDSGTKKWNSYGFKSIGFHLNKNYITTGPLIDELGSSTALSMQGPLAKNYNCKSVTLDVKSDQITSCYTEELFKPQDGTTVKSYFTRIDKDRWMIDSMVLESTVNLNLPILGSQKNMTIPISKIAKSYEGLPTANIRDQFADWLWFPDVIPGPYNYDGAPHLHKGSIYQSGVVFNNDLKVTKSCFRGAASSKPITLNQRDYLIDDCFEVNFKDSRYEISFKAQSILFEKPVLTNHRLVNTSKGPDHNSFYSKFCTSVGLDKAGYTVSNTEYIGPKSEKFIDLATDQILYKTDEDVNVINKIYCDPKSPLTTTDF